MVGLCKQSMSGYVGPSLLSQNLIIAKSGHEENLAIADMFDSN